MSKQKKNSPLNIMEYYDWVAAQKFENSQKHHQYVSKEEIDNNYFSIIFFAYDNHDAEMCWEVSVHIKDHSFCDERIKEFKSWYVKHYDRLFAEMTEMPKRFFHPELKLYDDEVQDFCIEFWNNGRDFMLFKLLDLLRLF